MSIEPTGEQRERARCAAREAISATVFRMKGIISITNKLVDEVADIVLAEIMAEAKTIEELRASGARQEQAIRQLAARVESLENVHQGAPPQRQN